MKLFSNVSSENETFDEPLTVIILLALWMKSDVSVIAIG